MLRRRLPACFGRGITCVSPAGGGLRYWRYDLAAAIPELIPQLKELISRGTNLWDIGANMGIVTFSAANLAGVTGSVLAIEPDVDNASLLYRSSCSMDKSVNALVTILPAAISSGTERIGQFQIASRSRAANALLGFGSSQMGSVDEIRAVPLFKLDELLDHFPPPDVFKIDVEGAEADVLTGASRILDEIRPKIIAEVSQEQSAEVTRLLKSHRYAIFDGTHASVSRVELDAAP